MRGGEESDQISTSHHSLLTGKKVITPVCCCRCASQTAQRSGWTCYVFAPAIRKICALVRTPAIWNRCNTASYACCEIPPDLFGAFLSQPPWNSLRNRSLTILDSSALTYMHLSSQKGSALHPQPSAT
ncbi:hypothetical protein Pelo_18141 [Pelomyxa schiedti]|nr:hypothetical protein Pelo_18141 [Pelomyxa schiedti]